MNQHLKTLNIKNPEAHKLAKELAKLTGESMATAVTEALHERLDRLRQEQGRQSRTDRLIAIIDDCAARLNAPGRKMMEVDDLYDEETGLPK
jgi:antitoxin VapB